MHFLSILITLATLPLAFTAPTSHLKIRTPPANNTNIIPNSYIVVYNNDLNSSSLTAHISSISTLLTRRNENPDSVAVTGKTYDMDQLKGFEIEADATTISEIAEGDEIAYIEPNTLLTLSTLTTQPSPPWGLSRISHRSPPSQNAPSPYIYDSTSGSDSTVFILDTGIYTQHRDFEGRAQWGANFIRGSPDTDENGHGTHCAGTVGGKRFGVAKMVRLVAVKVLGRDGSGSNSGIISGIQYATRASPPNSILSMSLGGSYSPSLNSAVRSAVNSGMTVVVAAGNDNSDARNYSPASEPSVITVGAMDSQDTRASFSNYGSAVDIFAPGVGVRSAWIGGAGHENVISGTSMATPHVAGLAAYLISLEKLSGPAVVWNRLRDLATKGVVRNAAGSPNLLAYNGNGA